MSWSWRIARVAGIGIYIHATFPILLVWVGVDGFHSGGRAGAIEAVLFILAVLRRFEKRASGEKPNGGGR